MRWPTASAARVGGAGTGTPSPLRGADRGAGSRSEEVPRRMQVTVSSRHMEVPADLRAAAIEKISRLDRFLEGMDRAEGHFTHEASRRPLERQTCEVTLEGHGHHVRCKVNAAESAMAIDLAVEKLEQQLGKLKSRRSRKVAGARRSGSLGPGAAALDGAGDDEDAETSMADDAYIA